MRNTYRLNNPNGTISASELLRDTTQQILIQYYLMQQKIIMLLVQLTGKHPKYEIVLNFIMSHNLVEIQILILMLMHNLGMEILGRNIVKKMNIEGICGSNSTSLRVCTN